jgi:hypothetical protein
MSVTPYTDEEAATALVQVVGGTTWEAVTLARGYLATRQGTSIDDAAREMYVRGPQTLRRSRELLGRAATDGILPLLTRRERTGSAENPVTKLFPASVPVRELGVYKVLSKEILSSRTGSQSPNRGSLTFLTTLSEPARQYAIPTTDRRATR